MSTWTVQDANGETIAVGTLVDDGERWATVVSISDPDGDYDDELRCAVEVPPQVTVRLDDGTEERESTFNDTPVTWDDYPDGPSHVVYVCDVNVVPPVSRPHALKASRRVAS